MKILKFGLPALLVIVLVLAVLAPIGPVPGFFIGGTEADTPETWQDTSQLHEIKLQVPGTLPRVVIIWVIDYLGESYVVGGRESGWVQMIGSGSDVKLRMEDATYSVTATPVDSGWEPIMQAYIQKYERDYPDIVAGFPSIEEAQGSIGVFRLEP